MRGNIRQALAGLAIYVIALQAVLTAFVPPAGPAPGTDFAAAICHTVVDGDSGGGGVPAQLPQNCDHCILCAANAAAPTGPIGEIRLVSIATPLVPVGASHPRPALRRAMPPATGPPTAL
jgi:hypothetical protein